MTTNPMTGADTRKPFPRYLMDQKSRTLLDRMEDLGLLVEVVAPAVGSVEIVVTAKDGSTHTILGRSEELAATLVDAAASCGHDLSGEG